MLDQAALLTTAISTAVARAARRLAAQPDQPLELGPLQLLVAPSSAIGQCLTIVLPARLTSPSHPDSSETMNHMLALAPWVDATCLVGLLVPDVLTARRLDRAARRALADTARPLVQECLARLAPGLTIRVRFEAGRQPLEELPYLIARGAGIPPIRQVLLISAPVTCPRLGPLGQLMIAFGLPEDQADPIVHRTGLWRVLRGAHDRPAAIPRPAAVGSAARGGWLGPVA